MKNLIDELKELDKEEYKVSEDFSKNIIKSIKHDAIIAKIKRITSLASVACVLVIVVIIANNNGSFNSLKNNNYFQDFTNSTSEDKTGVVIESSTQGGTSQSEETYREESVVAPQESINSTLDKVDATTEEATADTKEIEKAAGAAKTYEYATDSYSGDNVSIITNVLLKNSIEYVIEDNNRIIVSNSNIKDLNELISGYEYKDIHNEADTVVIVCK